MADVNDIPDAELLGRAVRKCSRVGRKPKVPRWSVVADRFCLGSTYAAQLCMRFGVDPEEKVQP